MKVRKWIERVLLVILLILGLLFWRQVRSDTAAGETFAFTENTGSPIRGAEKMTDLSSEDADGLHSKEAVDLFARGSIIDLSIWEKTLRARMPEETPDAEKKVALTFDDGPSPGHTEALLDGLKEREVHASFFVTGANAEKYPEILKRIQEEGHLIGNHTYHHVQLTSANADLFREEIVATNEAIRRITGHNTEYIRPPYGSWDKKYEKELDMFPVFWSVDPRDWCQTDTASIVRKVLNDTEAGDIILLHDQYASSVAAALEIVDELKARGYRFVTVEEMLLD